MGSVGLLGSVLAVAQAAGGAAESRCAATEMIAAATASAPAEAGESSVQLRRARDEANAAESAGDGRELRRLCARALLSFADVAPEVLGRERGEVEAERARKLAVELSLANGTYVGPRRPQPVLTPEERWEKRRRKLVGHTVASGVVTGVALSAIVLPWAALLFCNARTTDPFGCGEGYGAVYSSMIAAPVAVIAAIPLGIWAHQLRKHDQSRPTEPTHPRYRVRTRFFGSGLRVDF